MTAIERDKRDVSKTYLSPAFGAEPIGYRQPGGPTKTIMAVVDRGADRMHRYRTTIKEARPAVIFISRDLTEGIETVTVDQDVVTFDGESWTVTKILREDAAGRSLQVYSIDLADGVRSAPNQQLVRTPHGQQQTVGS